MDPLLSWASEAHWSIGGLCFKRLRLQGRIEGNIERLRAQHRRTDRINKKNSKRAETRPGIAAHKIRNLDEEPEWQESSESELEPEPEKVVGPAKEAKAKLRKRVRKLVDEFERVADAGRVVYRTRSKKSGSDKEGEGKGTKTKGTPPRRTSPRKPLA